MYNIKEIVLFEKITDNNIEENILIDEDILEVHNKLIDNKDYSTQNKIEIKRILKKIIEENNLLKEKIIKKIEFENLFCFGLDNKI